MATDSQHTEALVRAYQGGDAGAADEFLARYYPFVRKVVAQHTGRRARDMGEETILLDYVLPSANATPTEEVRRNELEERLEGALLELDERSRHVVVMRCLLGMSYDDIADELEFAGPSSARSLLHRSLVKLSAKLAHP